MKFRYSQLKFDRIFESKETIGLILLALVLLFKLPMLYLPYVDDELGYVMPAAKWTQENCFSPFTGTAGAGHPPLFYEFIAIIWTVFGNSLVISHLVACVFSFFTLYFTFLLGAYLHGTIPGFIAALFLFFSPIFFAHSGIGTLDLPLSTFAIMTLYFFYKSNYRAYLLSGICLVLTKETGVVFISAITAYVAYKNFHETRRDLFRQVVLYSTPILVYFIWLIGNRFVVGWFFYPFNVSLFSAIRHFDLAFFIRAPNQLFFYDFRWILTIILLVSMLFKKIILQKEYTLFVFILSVFMCFFTLVLLPRHIIIILPIFFIISSSAFYSIFGKNKIILSLLTLAVIIIFSTKWYGKASQYEWAGPTNLEYIDYLKVNKSAISYIEINYPDATVMGEFFGGNRLFQESYLGFVNNPLDTIDLTNHKINLEAINFYILYYSPSIFAGKTSREIIQNFNLKMIKRFEQNGKFVELYTRW